MARASSSSKTSSPCFSSTFGASRGTIRVPLDLRVPMRGRESGVSGPLASAAAEESAAAASPGLGIMGESSIAESEDDAVVVAAVAAIAAIVSWEILCGADAAAAAGGAAGGSSVVVVCGREAGGVAMLRFELLGSAATETVRRRDGGTGGRCERGAVSDGEGSGSRGHVWW